MSRSVADIDANINTILANADWSTNPAMLGAIEALSKEKAAVIGAGKDLLPLHVHVHVHVAPVCPLF